MLGRGAEVWSAPSPSSAHHGLARGQASLPRRAAEAVNDQHGCDQAERRVIMVQRHHGHMVGGARVAGMVSSWVTRTSTQRAGVYQDGVRFPVPQPVRLA